MRTFEPKTKYKDSLAMRRHRRFLARWLVILILALACVAGIGYAIFFSPWFVIKDVSISGLNSDHATEVNTILNERLGRKTFGVPTGRNVIFFKAKSLAEELKGDLSYLDDISISKANLHSLVVTGIERKPAGVWCFNNKCHYFDREGIMWGEAIRSTGFLMLNVDDRRDQVSEIDKRFLSAIQQVADRFEKEDLKIKNVTIPNGSFTEFNTLVSSGYTIRFSLDSDLAGQLDALFIFKKNKLDGGTLHPQYLDLRFDGRVYYK